jgi:NADH:ubiquinone oxidoreductase subunit F (NADH-binding)
MTQTAYGEAHEWSSQPAVLTPLAAPRLLAGPDLDEGAEPFDTHRTRLGRRPVGGRWMVDELERSGLLGRGGAAFPAHRKWKGVADHARDRGATVVVNASEGEPLSAKDAAMLSHRPHLVIDGALIAAESIGASAVIIYASRTGGSSMRALRRALRERRRAGPQPIPVRVVVTAHRYVAGESSAVVRRIGGGQSKPRSAPPHPSEFGVDGRPTLVQNVETLAHTALIARYGAAWFRERGVDHAPGTALVTVSGNVRRPGVYEIDVGTPLQRALRAAGGVITAPSGALIGGYFGSWLGGSALDDVVLAPEDTSLGCGVIGVLGTATCGIAEAARIATYLAAETAGQCGPCVFGLRAIAATMERVAASDADRGDIARLDRWTAMVAGRGGCHHPDGAVRNILSALAAFSADLEKHLDGRSCPGAAVPSLPPPPKKHRGWR